MKKRQRLHRCPLTGQPDYEGCEGRARGGEVQRRVAVRVLQRAVRTSRAQRAVTAQKQREQHTPFDRNKL